LGPARHLWDVWLISDPDLGRLRKGLHAVLGAGLAALVLSRLARLLGEPPTVTLVGTMVAMMGSQLASDTSVRAQRLTTALMVVPALSSAVVGTLVAQVPLLGAASFAAAIFLSAFVRRFGPRGTALGMIGFFSFFNALFFHVKVEQIPVLGGAMLVAVAIAFLVRFVLIPDRPERDLQRLLRAFRRTLDVVLWELRDVPERPRLTPALVRRLSRQADRLSDSALALDERLARDPPELRQRLFEAELAASRVLGAVRQVVHSGALGHPVREEMRKALVAARVALRGHAPAAARLTRQHLERVRALSPDPAGDEPGSADARRFLGALGDLLDATARLPERLSARVLEQEAAPSASTTGSTTQALTNQGLHPSTRQALQVTVACVLAMAVGHAVSAERWYWAVITAFVIFTRTRTSGDTLLRAWARVLGTVLGVVAGLLVARLISGHGELELVSIFACVFLGFYLLQVSYAWMVFWFTTLLSILYGVLGRFSPGLLYLRLEETLIGAVIGVTTALLLLPERTSSHVRRSARQVLDAVGDYLEEAVVNRTPETNPRQLLDSARVLDARLRDLRTAATPLFGGLGRFSPRAVRTVVAVSELVLSVRHLEMGRGLLSLHGDARERFRAAGRQLAENTRALADGLGAEEPPRHTSSSGLLDAAQCSLVGEETRRRGPASPPIVLYWLRRVDESLAQLAQALHAPARQLLPRRTWARPGEA
jgi:uncharacterized membrane protein YgaE (UPF0421/DUF939 family)